MGTGVSPPPMARTKRKAAGQRERDLPSHARGLCFRQGPCAAHCWGFLPAPCPPFFGRRRGADGAQATRPIRSGMLNASRRLYIRPVKRVVFPRPSGTCVTGRLIFGGAWRLDAFSAYPFATWLPGDADGSTTGTPEVARPRSSRTRGRSRQPSCACGG